MRDVYPGRGGVIITGGASGIGLAVARRLAADGVAVAILDRDGDSARRSAREIGAEVLVADVADSAQLGEAMRTGSELMGGLRGLVNNAGVGNLKDFAAYSDAEIDLVLRVNLLGTYYGMRAALPLMRSGGRGAIVNIASVSGVRPTLGEAPYSAAKAGIIALTSSGALEFSPEVRVNCVSPGFIRTPLNEILATDPQARAEIVAGTPAARLGEADDVAELVAFLLSERSSFLTGQNIVLDGGSVNTSKQMDTVLRGLLRER